jgi:hypothetical protein
MRKYGEDKFDVVTLVTTTKKEKAYELEKEWIEWLGTYEHGYNMTTGGDRGPKMTGEDNPMYGRTRDTPTYRATGQDNPMYGMTGEDCPGSKLSQKQAGEVKWLALNSDLTQTEIGAKYGIGCSQVSRIKREVKWSHIDPKKPTNYNA